MTGLKLKIPQDLIFQLHQFFLSGCDIEYEGVLLLLQFRALLPYHDTQKLGLETLFLYSKVGQGSLSGDLRRVVRVTHLSCDVKAEVEVVLYVLVTKTYDVGATY